MDNIENLEIVKIEAFNFHNILLDDKLYENILIYDISYKILITKL